LASLHTIDTEVVGPAFGRGTGDAMAGDDERIRAEPLCKLTQQAASMHTDNLRELTAMVKSVPLGTALRAKQ